MNSPDHSSGRGAGDLDRATVRIASDGLVLDAAARAVLGAGESIARDALSAHGPKIASPPSGATLAEWLWSEAAGDGAESRWRLYGEGGDRIDVEIANDCAVLSVAAGALSPPSRSLRHEVRNFVNAVQVNAELIALHGEKVGEPRIAELIGRIKRSCGSLGALLDEQRSTDARSCDLVTGMSGMLVRSGVERVRVETDAVVLVPVDWCLSAGRLMLEWLAGLRAARGDGLHQIPVVLDLDAGRRAVRISVAAADRLGSDPTRGSNLAKESGTDTRRDGLVLFGDSEPAAPDFALPGATEMLEAAGIGFGVVRSRDAAAVYVALP